jgi:geranylgeranyl diphosphate synthase type I
MSLAEYSDRFLPEIEAQIKLAIEPAQIDQDNSLHQMLGYHLGWFGQDAGPKAKGKRIRPLILLLVTEAVGGNFRNALPAAAAVEILHNFSLIHDDIEDNSDQRRGRDTLWQIHDIPLALNAGDAMFSLAFLSLDHLQGTCPPEVQLKSHQLFAATCLSLTKGQHLDISFENQPQVDTSEYLKMIGGKTAALLATSMQIGALLGGASQELQDIYHQLGTNVGLAFQVHDDILGIWGDTASTGKSTATDLITRKKSLPILFGLEQRGIFAEMWKSEITSENVSALSTQLETEGALAYAQQKAAEYTKAATNLLAEAASPTPAGEALAELIDFLIQREA